MTLLVAIGVALTPQAFADYDEDAKLAAEAHARAISERQKMTPEARAELDAKREALLEARAAARLAAQKVAAETQSKTYLAPFRERLDLEIHYIERTCGLTDGQAAALRKHGSEIADRAQAELAKALAAQAGQPRQAVVIVNGNAVAVPAGVNADYLIDPAQVARSVSRSELLWITLDALPQEGRVKLEQADEQRHQRALAATRLAALMVLDEGLLLSTPQRDAIGHLLDAAWTVPVTSDRNPILARPARAAEMLHSARLVLPKAKLAAILRPAQRAALKSLLEAAAQPARQPQGMMGGGMMGGGMMGGGGMQAGNMPLGGMKRRAPAANLKPVRRGPVLGLQMNGNGGQPFAGQGVEQLFNLGPRSGVAVGPESELHLMVDDVTAACDLSDEQRTKLLLAGRLDMKRVAPGPEHDAIKGVGVNQQAGLAGQVRIVGRENDMPGAFVLQADQILLMGGPRPEAIFSDRSSAYQKMLDGKLSDEQRQRLSAARRERLAMHQRAVVAAVLQAIDQRVLLSHQQHQRLTEFLEVPIADDRRIGSTGGPREDVLARLAHVSARELEAMLDDVQRPLAMRVWQELWATAAAGAVPGAIEQEPAGGLNRF